ncbi:F-box/LRR-repeat protein [Trifolium repens]|nr:F-box/LRR-repeat protein [Trifolium repens]
MEREKRRKTRRHSKKEICTTGFYLPDECWESIFKFIISDNSDIYNCRYLESLSLVSKQFLSVTSRLQYSLTIGDSTRRLLPRLFQRFTNLTSLNLASFKGDIDGLLCKISRFPLSLKSLNLSYKPTIPTNGLRVFSQNITTLTSLTCSNVVCINDTDLFFIADYFPLLEELDLHSPKKLENYESLRNGLKALSSALFKLRKINLTGHHYITDQSLFQLFKNWKLLEEAVIFCCDQITNSGIAIALCERPTLRSLSFSYLEPADSATFPALVSNCPSLSEISLESRRRNIVNYNPFVVCPQLKSLCLAKSYWLSEESIKILVSLFPNLQLLDLSYFRNISGEGICQVLRRCSNIRHLNLTHSLGVNLHGINFEFPRLEVLNLCHTKVDDETLYIISKSCRRLLQLLLKHCCNVTEKGVKHVVENCTQLKEINLVGCLKVNANVVAVFSRPLLRMITAPPFFH